MTPLERFALDVLDHTRQEFGDVDGGWIQDRGLELGILETVEDLRVEIDTEAGTCTVLSK